MNDLSSGDATGTSFKRNFARIFFRTSLGYLLQPRGEMAQEIDEGIAYLMALKHSAPEATAVAPARTPAPDAMAGVEPESQFKGAEKRRSPRYKCEGGVEMRDINCEDVHTWANFTDISVHGCYVEAQATYPVGTELQMKLQAHGLKIETRGIVRVNYPFLGMGIALVDVSEENREQMKQLVAAVTRPRLIAASGVPSSLPAFGPLQNVPEIVHPQAAVQALLEFFQTRQILMRDDFLRVLRTSQSTTRKL